VQPEVNPSMKVSRERGEPTTVPNAMTVADGLVANRPGKLTFALAQQYVDDVLLVSEEEIVEATVRLLGEEKLVVEPSGAASVAALVRYFGGKPAAAGRQPAQKVVTVLSGGNIELGRLADMLKEHARQPTAAPVRS
jgi:threonine dehydratase